MRSVNKMKSDLMLRALLILVLLSGISVGVTLILNILIFIFEPINPIVTWMDTIVLFIANTVIKVVTHIYINITYPDRRRAI
jgi:hypothetical protein